MFDGQEYVTNRLTFQLYDDGYWAIDENNYQYHVSESIWAENLWSASVTRQSGFSSVTKSIGAAVNPEELFWLCDESDIELTLPDSANF